MAFKNLFKFIKRVFKNKKRPKRRKQQNRKKAKHKKIIRVRRKVKKRVVTRKPKQQKKAIKALPVGLVTHYYPNVKAAVIKLKRPLSVGEPILIKGRATDFRQTVGSMQIDRVPIEKGKRGQEIGLEVMREVRQGDVVYTLSR